MKKNIVLIGLFLLLINRVFSQETNRKIYFLADTINTAKNNQVLQIKTISFFEYSFIFYCKCAAPYKSYVSFYYLTSKKGDQSEIVSKKPDYPYISYKSLMDISNENHRYFNDRYDLYITEALPNHKYRTNKVKFILYPEPIKEYIILDKKQ